jgi:hypothetical protein
MKNLETLYQSGLSGINIAKIKNLKIHQVYYLLQKAGITRRSNKENYALNLANNFITISSELEAYLLGILLTDGQIQDRHQSSKILRLDLAIQDIAIIELLQNYLGLNNRIKIYKRPSPNQDIARLVVPSDSLCENLSKYGVVPRKTFFVKFPQIEDRLKRHFIRGCSDGDGCISGTTWKLVGTENFLLEVQRILIANLDFNQTRLQQRHKNRINNIRSLEYGGRKQLTKLYNFFYQDSIYFMGRKQAKWYEIIKRYL